MATAAKPTRRSPTATPKAPATSSAANKATKAAAPAAAARAKDAIALLKADHREAEKLFKAFEKASDTDRVAIAQQVCQALIVHTTIEEEIYYPAVKPKVEDDMVNEAVVEHASAKDLIAQIMAMDGSEELYAAKVTVLSELIGHHVEEEEEEMFPQSKKAGVDLKALGAQLAARKAELMAAM